MALLLLLLLLQYETNNDNDTKKRKYIREKGIYKDNNDDSNKQTQIHIHMSMNTPIIKKKTVL